MRSVRTVCARMTQWFGEERFYDSAGVESENFDFVKIVRLNLICVDGLWKRKRKSSRRQP